MNMNDMREDYIYARQSVDRKDSISIESQIEFCKYELRGGSCRIFTDKGYSGKNTDRPSFQKLMADVRRGKVQRVIVYKLDRISRSILDFATMMETFQEYNVEFVSATEKFDTSTPMGRAMLNICIVFAQLERETIQKRVTDSFYSRCTRGFHMAGVAPWGMKLEPTVIDGIHTKMVVPDPETENYARLVFEMYAKPETSYGDVIQYFEQQGLTISGKLPWRSFFSNMLCNPLYAQADMELYDFFKGHGALIVNDASDFIGTNGCYLYKGRDAATSKKKSLKGQILVLAPGKGLVSSRLWLTCYRKRMANVSFQPGRKPRNTWLAGKIKCGRCGYALRATHINGYSYFHCTKRSDNRGCPGCGTLRQAELEQFVFNAMREKLWDFEYLQGGDPKASPELVAHKVELAQTETEIEKLLESLQGANTTLMAYANRKVEELDVRRRDIMQAINDLEAEALSQKEVETLSGYLDGWDDIDFQDKLKVADSLISTVKATSDHIEIAWKI